MPGLLWAEDKISTLGRGQTGYRITEDDLTELDTTPGYMMDTRTIQVLHLRVCHT